MAMTVVLPAPVASFSARRISSGLASLFAAGEMIQEPLAVPVLRRDLGQPDRRLDRLDLAEERADAAELVVPPVLEQPGGFRRHLPLVGIGQGPPRVHMSPDLVDDRGRVVLLLLGREALPFVEDKALSAPQLLALLRLRDRRDELGTAPGVDDLLGGLAGLVQLPVPRRVLVGGVQDRLVEERIGHAAPYWELLASARCGRPNSAPFPASQHSRRPKCNP